jgi:MFS family permease
MTGFSASPSSAATGIAEPEDKWRAILLLSLAELLVMAVWFSASAVLPALTTAWDLSDSGRAGLTMSVQVGFVVGAFGSAVFALADRIPARRFFAGSALLAGATTALIPLLVVRLEWALGLRFLTGVFLAGVYPVGMKIMTTWTRADRGLSIGMLVGALTVGSASPHLISAFGGVDNWQPVLYLAAGAAWTGAWIALQFIEEGPFRSRSPSFRMGHIRDIFGARDIMLANLGYLGHMWELYAMWTWIPAFLLASIGRSGAAEKWASALAFAVISVGGLGSIVAGKLADQVGRVAITTGSLAVSGACALGIGALYGSNPALLAAVALIWGFAVVADSAQFSACVSELADRQIVGTALTLQTSLGFLLTLVTIRLLPVIQNAAGWEWAFAPLALGPLGGIAAMLALKRCETAVKLAGKHRC